MSTKADLEDRLDSLETRLAIVEARLRRLSRERSTASVDDASRDRLRLSHIIRTLRRLGGSGKLDEIARGNPTITKAGTRAQLMRLVDTGDVENPSHGHYRLVKR